MSCYILKCCYFKYLLLILISKIKIQSINFYASKLNALNFCLYLKSSPQPNKKKAKLTIKS